MKKLPLYIAFGTLFFAVVSCIMVVIDQRNSTRSNKKSTKVRTDVKAESNNPEGNAKSLEKARAVRTLKRLQNLLKDTNLNEDDRQAIIKEIDSIQNKYGLYEIAEDQEH